LLAPVWVSFFVCTKGFDDSPFDDSFSFPASTSTPKKGGDDAFPDAFSPGHEDAFKASGGDFAFPEPDSSTLSAAFPPAEDAFASFGATKEGGFGSDPFAFPDDGFSSSSNFSAPSPKDGATASKPPSSNETNKAAGGNGFGDFDDFKS